MDSIEATTVGDKLRPLLLEHLPHRLLGPFRMGMRLGVGDAFVDQPGVQFVVALDPQARREGALRTRPTWFSTWPFFQPDAGVQATGSTR